MKYSTELDFFRNIIKNLHLDSYIISGTEFPDNIDHGLRDFLGIAIDYERIFAKMRQSLTHNTIYMIADEFMCNFIFMLLPDTNDSEILICGPYINADFTRQKLMEKAERYDLSPQMFSQFEKYYGNITLIADDAILISLFNGLGEKIWGNIDSFTIQRLEHNEGTPVFSEAIHIFEEKSEESLLAISIIEARYESERILMEAVSKGLSHKVTHLINHASEFVFENRTEDTLRNTKNYMIVMNTLLRKSAQAGGVPPYFIDKVSSLFAKRIEATASIKDMDRLPSEMVEHYCRLVNEHSLKKYSMPVQKAMAMIDYDLTADLSLKNIAKALNMNASYFSAIFKKESGKTLTEYVIAKKMDNAAMLLSSTNLQIQTIAQHCGILDVNYFTKLFKKHMGTTPGKYRENAR